MVVVGDGAAVVGKLHNITVGVVEVQAVVMRGGCGGCLDEFVSVDVFYHSASGDVKRNFII